MKIKDLKRHWNKLGKNDPFWAVLTDADKKGQNWDEEEFFRSGEVQIERFMKKVKRFRPDMDYKSALDFGCGIGRLTRFLSLHYEKTIGVDIAPSMIELAKKKNTGYNCEFVLNDKMDLSLFDDNSFDTIITFITLQHMRPFYARKFIKEFIRIIKPEGLIIFQVPSRLKAGIRGRYPRLYNMTMSIDNMRKKMRGDSEPRMEMYGIPIERATVLIESSGGTILNITKNNFAGDEWLSFTYIVSKSR